MINEQPHRSITLNLLGQLYGQMHCGLPAIILHAQAFHRDPRQNIHHGQLGHPKNSPVEWSAAAAVLRVQVQFQKLMEEVQRAGLVALGGEVEAVEAVGVLGLVIGTFFDEHLADLEVAVERGEMEGNKHILR